MKSSKSRGRRTARLGSPEVSFRVVDVARGVFRVRDGDLGGVEPKKAVLGREIGSGRRASQGTGAGFYPRVKGHRPSQEHCFEGQ